MKIRSHKSSCHVCQKEEKSQYLIHKHIATEHTGDWNFPTKCEECDFVGRYERSLQWHMDQASDIEKYILILSSSGIVSPYTFLIFKFAKMGIGEGGRNMLNFTGVIDIVLIL